MYFIPEAEVPLQKHLPTPHIHIILLYTKENYILQVSESSVILILHIYCTLLRELGREEGFVVHICSGYCLCRSD